MRKLNDELYNPKAIISDGRIEDYWSKKSYKRKNTKIKLLVGKGDLLLHDSVDYAHKALEKYKIKGFEFGNWLTQAERESYLVAGVETLEDLSKAIGSQNIGFDANVGVAFGARGKGKALAHYEPVANMINLTKMKGAGSFAHEWGHAIDYNAGFYIDQNAQFGALTGGRSTAETLRENTGGQLRYYANAIVDTIKDSASYARLKSFEEYWHRRTEIFARFFEQYICYKTKGKNPYLAKNWSIYTSRIVYLTEADFKKVLPFAERFVKEIALFLNNKGKLRKMGYHLKSKTTIKTVKVAKPVKKAAAKTTAKRKK